MARTERAADAESRRTGRRVAAGLLAWLGLSALLTAVGALGLGACGIAWPSGRPILAFCPDSAAAQPDDGLLVLERQRQHDLLSRLNEIRLALVNAPNCPAPPVEVAELQPVEGPDPPELAEPASPALPTEQEPPAGDVPVEAQPTPTEPPPPEAPVPEARPEPPPEPERPEPATAVQPTPEPVPDPAPESPENIPEEEWAEGDVSLLEGCWALATDYSITQTDTGEEYRTRDWQMCFDESGRGSQTLNFDNGMSCSGDVDARFDPSGALVVVDQGMVPCDTGVGIDQRIMRCFRLPDGTAACSTQHTEPPANPVSVRFQR